MLATELMQCLGWHMFCSHDKMKHLLKHVGVLSGCHIVMRDGNWDGVQMDLGIVRLRSAFSL